MRDAMRVRLIFTADFLPWGRALFEPFALGVGMTMRDAMRDANFFTFSFRSSGSGYRFPFGYGGALSVAVARRGSYLLWRLAVGCPSSLYALQRLFKFFELRPFATFLSFLNGLRHPLVMDLCLFILPAGVFVPRRFWLVVGWARSTPQLCLRGRRRVSRYVWPHMFVSPISLTRSREYCRAGHVVFRASDKLHAGFGTLYFDFCVSPSEQLCPNKQSQIN